MTGSSFNFRFLFARHLAFCLLLIAYCSAACSVPNLEAPECDQARDIVREFYSFHFGHNLGVSEQDLNARRDFLTPEFFASLHSSPRDLPTGVDPFTRTADVPKAFRAGECKVIEPGKRTSFEVLLFWKDDVRSEQRPIDVELENRDGKWLIDKISNNVDAR